MYKKKIKSHTIFIEQEIVVIVVRNQHNIYAEKEVYHAVFL